MCCCRVQKTISLPSKPRGCHIVTRDITRELADELHGFEVGMANFFIQHTSASLTINENASPDVPLDLNVSAAPHQHEVSATVCMPYAVHHPRQLSSFHRHELPATVCR